MLFKSCSLVFHKNSLLSSKMESLVIQNTLSKKLATGRQLSPEKELLNSFRSAMRHVPQPVVVVTAAAYREDQEKWYKRGFTCSSFTSVSYKPPIISVCMANPSRMHDLVLETQKFAVHVLASDQVKYGVLFSKPLPDDVCQFSDVPHEVNPDGIPILPHSTAVLHCKAYSVDTVGDHHVWYGEVKDVSLPDVHIHPLLYFTRSFRSVGDEIFLKAFEDATLPFEDWTHEAHLRMAWNYIREHGRDDAAPFIKSGIKKFNEQNKEKIKYGYHETITIFFIHQVADAIRLCGDTHTTFDDFVKNSPQLFDTERILEYYSKELLASEESKLKFIPPDKRALP